MEITNNIKLNIAEGRTARSKVWKNKKTDWAKLVKRLKSYTRTNETFKEYQNANKGERGKIKDVGGYVGGYLRAGRRKPENVVHRQLITLDLDFAHLDIWDDFTMMYDNAAVLHSTHSHSIENPKYRLIMPIDREVTPDEYVAIARQIAGNIGIDYFDNTGFQPYRLMFWGSCSKDVEYVFNFQDGKPINADEVLDSYLDWRDSSLYPMSGQYESDVKKLTKKQQDPDEKKGVIGAFCRSYSISEAIETFLTEHYTEAGEDRYTYLKGSTAGGLITYDDKFSYSHHGTDPTSGQLCNAFDLVRLHLYGHLDEGSTAPTNKRPSFKEMELFTRKDKKVRRTIAEESLQAANYDFADDYKDEPNTEDEEDNLVWAENLEIDGRGKYLSSANNLNLILSNDKRLKGAFKYNEFDRKRYVVKSLPWRVIDKVEPIRNVDYSGIRNYLETIYNIIGTSKIDDCLALEFEKNSYHPIKDYLNGVEWDGVERVDKLLVKYFGTEDNLYTREAIRKMLVGAVARIFEAGVKFDLTLVLVGEQGTFKSTFISKLGGIWFSDSFSTFHGKDAFEQLQGAWLIEMAELSGLRKSDVETVKHFTAKQEDTYRPAYGRTTETYLRQCVFFGTTNKKGFLTDPTGNRRFMPIDINVDKRLQIPSKMTKEEIDQIWAEAVSLYRKGEKLYLSKEADKLHRIEQTAHTENDERAGIIEKYLNEKLPKNWTNLPLDERRMFLESDDSGEEDRYYVCVAEIWAECLGMSIEGMTRYKTKSINDILRGLEDWEQAKSPRNFPIYGKQRYYSRKLF